MQNKLIIVGGGASGIVCAITAKRHNPQLQITILEKNDRIGKKILKTGNGKCNISNLNITETFFNHKSKLKPWLEQIPVNEVLTFFQNLGLFLKTDGSTRLYPYSESATTVLEVLRYELEYLQIEVVCNVTVTGLQHDKQWIIHTNQRDFVADYVVMATGSLAQEKTMGYQILEKMGHDIIPVRPALVALKTKEHLRGLQGLRVKCQASIFHNQQLLYQDTGEILFKEDGLSGILALDLSRYFTNSNVVSLDLLFDHPDLESELKELLTWKKMENALMGILPKMLVWEVLRRNPDRNLKAIVQQIHHLNFEVVDTYGFDFAQIACGGVDLNNINADFCSKKHPNLYIVGEVLDVDGASGGYNLHFAWISGMIAGKAIADF
ncbi:MAG: aminoacetone oxidase family FAD-binding enzyme [Bacilli bacterium]